MYRVQVSIVTVSRLHFIEEGKVWSRKLYRNVSLVSFFASERKVVSVIF